MLKVYFRYSSDFSNIDNLRTAMYRARTNQFVSRLGWPLFVNSFGEETDEYDSNVDPIYVILVSEDEKYVGSMRLLPTVGRTLIGEHFSHLTSGRKVRANDIWECTRFNTIRGSGREAPYALLAAGSILMEKFGVRSLIAVFDDRILQVYRRLRCSPTLMGSSNGIFSGYWNFDKEAQEYLISQSGIDRPDYLRAFADVFFDPTSPEMSSAPVEGLNI